MFGTSAQKLGRTRGQHEASGSFELYRPEFMDLQSALQGAQAINNLSLAPGVVPGLFEVNFGIQVTFSESAPLGVAGPLSMPTQTDSLVGCRIVKVDQSHSQGSDALTVKCDIDIMYVAYNLAIPINVLLKAAGGS